MRRPAAVFVACVVFSGLSPVLGAAPERATAAPADHVPPQPPSDDDAVGWANWVRAFGENLPPLQWDESLVEGARVHAEWIQEKQFEGYLYCGTTQMPPHLVWPEGENHRVDVARCGELGIGTSMREWSQSPFDGARLVDPASTAVGTFCCPGLIVGGVSTAAFAGGGPAVSSRWPKPGGVLPGTSFYSPYSGACGLSGRQGLPVFLSLPAVAAFGSASITDQNGLVVPSCAVRTGDLEPSRAQLVGGDPVRQVAVVAERPYTAGETYEVSITVGGVIHPWSFTPVAAPLQPAAVQVFTSAPLEVTATWQPADGRGLPITGYRVRTRVKGDEREHILPPTQTSLIVSADRRGSMQVDVAAINALGVGESRQASAHVIDQPLIPYFISLGYSSPGEVYVHWTADDMYDPYPSQVAAFELEVNGEILRYAIGTGTNRHIQVTPGVPHTFRVRSLNLFGAGPWSVPEAPRSSPHLPLPSVAMTLVDDTTARAEWSVLGSPLRFDVDIDGTLTDVGTARSVTIPGLTPGQLTTIRVREVTADGPGEWSFARSIVAPTRSTTPPPTTPPGGPPISIEPPVEPPEAPPGDTQMFRPLSAPQRVADTRVAGGPLVAGETRRFSLDGVLAPGDSAAAISLNLTATNAAEPGYLSAFPCDSARPTTSSVNYKGGEPGVPNHVVVPVSAGHELCVYAYSESDVVIDVDGWFRAGTGVTAQSPWRALDTRTTAKARAITEAAVVVAPAGAVAALVNVTVAGGSAQAGYVTAYSCGHAVPATSTVNFLAGEVIANGAVVPVDDAGSICLHASTPTDVAIDVTGYVTDGFTPITPTRVLDTRTAGGAVTTAHVFTQAPAGTTAAAINLTVAGGATTAGFATAFAPDAPQPNASNVNFSAGQVVANSAVVRVDPAGTVEVAASTPAHFVVDVTGYFN